MFRRRIFYYIFSFIFVFAALWAAKNSETLFPTLVEWMNKKETLCLALPKVVDSEGLRNLFSQKPFAVQIMSFEDSEGLEKLLIESECEVYLFPSDFLSHFSDSSRLVKFGSNEIDLSRVSPDFLGLKFDRLNEFFVPVAFWQDAVDETKTNLHIVLAVATVFTKDTNLAKKVFEDFLSKEFQQAIAGSGKLGTVLRDGEIDVPMKSSLVRKNSLKDLTIVK